MENKFVKALFLDIGGVLMTNGWDRKLRQKTADKFQIDLEDMTERHGLVFDTYETGKISFDEYLKRIIFYQARPYSMDEVKQFIFDAVRPYQEMMDYVKELKATYHLKIGVVSNEGRGLAEDRIKRFNLIEFVDFFIISSFVHFRKPDPDIYRLAIDVAQIPPNQIVYIDDRALLIQVAKELGIKGIHHTSLETTKEAIQKLLQVPAGAK